MNLIQTDDAELLGAMALQATDRERARAAWGELFLRHRRYLFVVVSRAYGAFLGEDGSADLVTDTFRRAYEWAGRQHDAQSVRDQFSAADADGTRRKVLGWLGAIAERLFKDRYRADKTSEAQLATFLDQWSEPREEAPDLTDVAALDLVTSAMSALSVNEAEALRISLPWYDLESGTFAVPRGEAARVAAALGTTPESLRQRRHRAIQRIHEHLRQAGYTVEGKGTP